MPPRSNFSIAPFDRLGSAAPNTIPPQSVDSVVLDEYTLALIKNGNYRIVKRGVQEPTSPNSMISNQQPVSPLVTSSINNNNSDVMMVEKKTNKAIAIRDSVLVKVKQSWIDLFSNQPMTTTDTRVLYITFSLTVLILFIQVMRLVIRK